ADETVVRFISVQRADDIIAVAPRPRTVVVVLEALRLGKADNVEPVTAPLLPIVRRGEQPIDQFLVRVWRGIVNKRVDGFRSGGQAGQVEGEAADQSAPVGLRRRLGAFADQPPQDEGIDRRLDPGLECRIAKARNLRAYRLAKGPVSLGGRQGGPCRRQERPDERDDGGPAHRLPPVAPSEERIKSLKSSP